MAKFDFRLNGGAATNIGDALTAGGAGSSMSIYAHTGCLIFASYRRFKMAGRFLRALP